MRPRIALLIFSLNLAIAQNLTSPRGIGVSSLAKDALTFGWSPAGLMNIVDWNIAFSGYLNLKQQGASMQTINLAKRISENQVLGFAYSPTSAIEFVFPSKITVKVGPSTIRTEYEKKLTYFSNFALCYALNVSDKLSAGLMFSQLGENFSESEYVVETTESDTLPSVSFENPTYRTSKILLKAGLTYELTRNLLLNAVIEPQAIKVFSNIPEKFSEYEIKKNFDTKLGIGIKHPKLTAGLDISSYKLLSAQVEYSPFENLFLRAGATADRKSFNYFSISAGLRIGFIQFDIAFLKNLTKIWSDGILTQDEFYQNKIQDIETNKLIRDRILFSISADATGWYERSVGIRRVEIDSDIFPHLVDEYVGRRIGFIEVENMTQKTIGVNFEFESKNSLNIEAGESEITLRPREVKAVPVFVRKSYENRLASSQTTTLKIKVKSHPLGKNPEKIRFTDETTKINIVLRGRNDWNGEVEDLRFFVNFDSPKILNFVHETIFKFKDSISFYDPKIEKFATARLILNSLSKLITYINDPVSTFDRVQYPEETLELHGGDCDDLVVLVASLFGSAGIECAFVDVKALRTEKESHVYLLFDTGVEKNFASMISRNEKKYLIMRNRNGVETVWIPIETTLVMEGFEKAWETGAKQYFEDVELNLGIAKSKVKIIPIQK